MFYYTTHCKDEFYLSGTHRCVPYGSSNQHATKGKRTTLYTLRVRYTYGAIYLTMRYVLRTRYVSQSETRL